MILAFTGKKYSGKSAACQLVREILGETSTTATTINFKDALVKEITKNFPKLLEEIWAIEGEAVQDMHDLFRQKPPLLRSLMQNYGTEVRRGDDPEYWIKQWKSKVTYTDGIILCDDVRFLNEAAAVKDFDGIIIRLNREDNDSLDSHISETEMDKIEADHTIYVKEEGLPELKEKLRKIIEKNRG